jgi:hypothetical protein
MRILSSLPKNFPFLRIVGIIAILICIQGCDDPSGNNTPSVPQNRGGVSGQTSESAAIDVVANDESTSEGPSQDSASMDNATEKGGVKSEPSKIRFEELLDSGISFVREDDMRGSCRIFESTGGGVGALDFDRDGLVDLVFMGGCKLPEEANSDKPTCAIYRQNRPLKFSDCTTSSGLFKTGYCQGIAVGDWDNDGFDDVYITAFGPNGFYHNNGDGTFSDITDSLGVRMGDWSTSCAMADLNLDGNLDLYVVTYLDDSITKPLLCTNPRSPSGYEQCPPSKYKGVDDRLFLSDGNGGMIDVTAESGLEGTKGKGLGVAICDFDLDGKPEIYVANDGEANFLFELTIDENRRVKLNEIAMASGCALSRSGYAQASMGIAVGDYDNNGTTDLHLTNFYGDTNTIYKNSGGLKFSDVTRSTGITSPSKGVLGWGTVLADFDNDGWLDLFVANGHVEDRTWSGRGEPFQMPPLLLRNTGKGTFEDVSQNSGEYFEKKWLGRGVVNLDLNQDGLMDLIVSHQLSSPQILINKSKVPGLAKATVIGVDSNRNGLGVKMEYLEKTGEMVVFQELFAGGSYLSAGSQHARFVPKNVDRIRVHWPSGKSNTISMKESSIVELVEY